MLLTGSRRLVTILPATKLLFGRLRGQLSRSLDAKLAGLEVRVERRNQVTVHANAVSGGLLGNAECFPNLCIGQPLSIESTGALNVLPVGRSAEVRLPP